MAALRFISFFESRYHVDDNLHGSSNTELEGAWTWSDTLVIIMGAIGQQGMASVRRLVSYKVKRQKT
jgi:hypothetical protein